MLYEVITMFDLAQIRYHNVQESFGMGGPYIGELEFKGKLISGKFLADSETLNKDKNMIVFSRFLTQYSAGLLGLKTKRDFRILLRITSYNVCYTKLLRNETLQSVNNESFDSILTLSIKI